MIPFTLFRYPAHSSRLPMKFKFPYCRLETHASLGCSSGLQSVNSLMAVVDLHYIKQQRRREKSPHHRLLCPFSVCRSIGSNVSLIQFNRSPLVVSGEEVGVSCRGDKPVHQSWGHKTSDDDCCSYRKAHTGGESCIDSQEIVDR